MRITWHGHSCFEINDTIDLVVDPHDGVSLGLRRPDPTADVVLITHDHFDHNRADIVSTDGTDVVTTPGEHTIRDIAILGVEACHDKKRGAVRGKVVMFRFVIDGIRCLHVGDLCHALDEKVLKTLGEIDILFVPVGGTFTLDADEGADLVNTIKPLITIPMHYRIPGVTLEIDPVEPFLKKCGIPILKVGDGIDFIAEDLPDQREIWLFDY